MYSLILHGRRLVQYQKCCHLSSVIVNPLQNGSKSFSSTSAASDGPKGHTFTVSYLVDSLGLTTKLAQSISSKDKGNLSCVLSLFRSYGFTDSQISSVITGYPRLLLLDAETSLAPKLHFLQSKGGEFTQVVSTIPRILGKIREKTISRYYDFVKEIMQSGKCCSLGEGSMQVNKIRNVLVLRELGVPHKYLFLLLVYDSQPVCGREKFEASLKKVVEMGFDPTTSSFVKALQVFYQLSEKTIVKKVHVYRRLGFSLDDVWGVFKSFPFSLTLSEKNILNSIETFVGLGLSREEFVRMVKSFPRCIGYSAESGKKKTDFLVEKMNWPLKAVVSHPRVLGYSMEKRIVPRCYVVKALMSQGFLGSELPPARSVFDCNDQMFLNRYVRRQNDKQLVAELMSIFTGYRVS